MLMVPKWVCLEISKVKGIKVKSFQLTTKMIDLIGVFFFSE